MKSTKVLFICFVFSLLVTVASCSSKRKIKLADPTYVVVDNSSRENERPVYVFGEMESKWEKDKDYMYFIGEDNNINKTLCKKGASANATEKVVEHISQEIKSSFSQAIKNDNDNLDKQTSMLLQNQIESKLGGIENVSEYWEQQQYKKELGAEKNQKLFQCYKVVKIKKSILNEISDSVIGATVRVNDNKR